MNRRDSTDPRAKYRELPPVADATDTVESVDATEDTIDTDLNQGAGPYLRMILGPWAR